MQQRLHEIGDGLRVNGEAIYGTRPWKQARQWSAGEMPEVKYNSEFESAYDVTKLNGKPEAGKAAIEAFFTTKGNDLYAILPHWPGGGFLVKDVTGVKEVHLLGSERALKFKAVAGGVRVDIPSLPEDLFRQPCWVLKISR